MNVEREREREEGRISAVKFVLIIAFIINVVEIENVERERDRESVYTYVCTLKHLTFHSMFLDFG